MMIKIVTIAAALAALTALVLRRPARETGDGLKRFNFEAAKSLESRGG